MAGLTVDEGVWAAYMLAPTWPTCWRRSFSTGSCSAESLRTFPSSPAQTAGRFSSLGRNGATWSFCAPWWCFGPQDFHRSLHSGCGGRHGAHVPPGAAPAGRKGMHQRQRLLIFLTAAFAIGGTLRVLQCGRPAVSLLFPVFPQTFSPGTRRWFC